MTDTELAEELAEEYLRATVCGENCSELCEEPCVKAERTKKHFLAGLNKANEWHFMKDEFPPENVPLNIITLDKNKKKRLWEGEYQGGNGNWWSGYFNHLIDVPYAWKEIVLPEFLKE